MCCWHRFCMVFACLVLTVFSTIKEHEAVASAILLRMVWLSLLSDWFHFNGPLFMTRCINRKLWWSSGSRSSSVSGCGQPVVVPVTRDGSVVSGFSEVLFVLSVTHFPLLTLSLSHYQRFHSLIDGFDDFEDFELIFVKSVISMNRYNWQYSQYTQFNCYI